MWEFRLEVNLSIIEVEVKHKAKKTGKISAKEKEKMESESHRLSLQVLQKWEVERGGTSERFWGGILIMFKGAVKWERGEVG